MNIKNISFIPMHSHTRCYEFDAILQPDAEGTLQVVDISAVNIGEPCYLHLVNGDLVKTSKVTEWSTLYNESASNSIFSGMAGSPTGCIRTAHSTYHGCAMLDYMHGCIDARYIDLPAIIL